MSRISTFNWPGKLGLGFQIERRRGGGRLLHLIFGRRIIQIRLGGAS